MKQRNDEVIEQQLNEKNKFIEEIYDRTIEKLAETIQEIQEQLQQKLQNFRTEYEKSLKLQIQLLKQLQEDELIENLSKLKEQIKTKHEKLMSLKESLQVQLNPKFSIESIFKLPQQPEQLLKDHTIEPNPRKKNKSNNKCEYTCPKCGKKFWLRRDFGEHLHNAHNMIMKFQCPSCPFSEFDFVKLTPHLFEDHGIDSPESFHNKIYICPFTKQKFTLRPPLSLYVRDNPNYRVYE